MSSVCSTLWSVISTPMPRWRDRKSTRLNSSHLVISYAVFCLKKKDNNSRYTEAEVKNLVMESDVRIYAIGLFERPQFLEKLAALTGGETFWAHHLNDLPDAVD